MNSNRSSYISNSKITPRNILKTSRSKQSFLQKTKQQALKKLSNKYCTCQNYMTLSQINRTILDKQCILKTTIHDIKQDQTDEKMQNYYTISKATTQLPELIQYYKYYSQKSTFFHKDFFMMLYQYQEKRKIIEYNRLKVLLNLSDSQQNQSSTKKNKNNQSESGFMNKSRIGISRNFAFQNQQNKKYKNSTFQGNVLDDLNFSQVSAINEHEESLLINRLRNNLSKHIGPSKIKNLSIEELDTFFDFQKKDQMFNPSKQNFNFLFLSNGKPKSHVLKAKKLVRQQTHTNTPQQIKQKGNIRRRSAKRNNSCQNLTRISAPKNPYEPGNSKLRRKKNLSMDNLCTHTSTPYAPEQKRDHSKMRKFPLKSSQKDRYFKQNTLVLKGPQIFMENITDLKNKIKREKQRLMKSASGAYSSLKRQKTNYSSINTANQRFTKKNYEKLRQKTINGH